MGRPPNNVDARLEESLRRISGALEHNRSQYAAMVAQILASTSAEVAERIAANTDRAAARIAEKHQRRMERWQRRHERRQERRRDPRQRRDPAGEISRGVVFAFVAIVCLLLALRDPPLFWMVFVALGFGMSSVSAFGRAARYMRRDAEAEPTVEAGQQASDRAPAGTREAERTAVAPPPVPVESGPPDPKVTRIQNLCDKILAELQSGPPVVREVVTEPQATIGGLRRACVETARRERELRDVLASQDEAGLLGERDGLKARLATERDAIVRDRLGQALGALDQQLAHRAELATAATRLEAENTRILYTLENLHMQLLRARTTDIGGPELGGKLRDSLRELGAQIDAVAEALEFASAPSGAEGRAASVETPSMSDEARRAERAEAARRAAAAREAQRQ